MKYEEIDVVEMIVSTSNRLGKAAGADVYAKINYNNSSVETFRERLILSDKLLNSYSYEFVINEARGK